MFAAELRVKNAVTPLSRKQMKVSGNGFLRILRYTSNGFKINATIAIAPNNTPNKRA